MTRTIGLVLFMFAAAIPGKATAQNDAQSPVTEGAQKLTGGWEINVKTDAMTDGKVINLLLISSESKALLSFICSTSPTRSLRMGVGKFGFYVGNSNETETMMVRFGDEPPIDIDMYPSGANAMLWDENIVVMILRNLMQNDRVAFRLFSTRNSASDVILDVTGADQAVPKLLEPCGIEP